MPESFVHLHVHTEFSILDGMTRVDELVARASELGMPAVAMTDHGNLYAAIKFYTACKKRKIKPILGCEVYLAPGSMGDKRDLPGRWRSSHLTLLAETDEGWEHLKKLVTRGHLEGQYLGEPRVDLDVLREFSKGLLCLTGCLSGPVNEWLLADDVEKARETLARLLEIFGPDHLFVELMNHGLEAELKVNPRLLALAAEFGLRTVATNDVHFLQREDHEAQDVHICIGAGRLLVDENRRRYSPEVYFKTAGEMRALFADVPGACDATLEIAERCNVTIHLDSTSSAKYPQFDSPDGSPREEYLRRICQEGLVDRYGAEKAARPEIQERLKYEVEVINQLGFASYFLITADFIKWAREHGVPVGPGRGSAAGSLAAYSMGITNIDPLAFGLIFERFLNPERVSPPDVDIDFGPSGRGDVIEYVRKRYGERNVSHIITYGTMGAKSVLRDVARVMGVAYSEADRIAKMIEVKPKITLQSEWDAKPELRELIGSSSTYQELWNYALKLEGLTRSVGVHAAGVVIGDRPLDDHIPLTRSADGEVVTQYDMGAITEVGLLKMDFLGLKNLAVIQEAEEHIRERLPGFEVEKAPYDNQATFDLLNRGETMGVFQLESGGMVDTCRKYHLERIDDITDLLALYRPGSMQFIDEMIEVKTGRRKPLYEHPLLEKVSAETHGVMIYQEQVQNAAKLLAGYTLGGADLLRRAMGKKDPVKMAEERGHFIKGCWETNQIDEKLASAIFKKIEMFAGYGFNKSHSACYAHISYWTAYLKANFPVEFMAALLSNEINNTDKIGVFIAECHRMGIEVLPPDVNHSRLHFAPEDTPSGTRAIRYGLAAIKNVGEAAMAQVVSERGTNGPYQSLENFANRLDSRVVNKRILENLVKAGAFDWTGEERAAMNHRLELVCASASSVQRDRETGQVSLFGDEDFGASPAPVAEAGPVPAWTKDELLTMEKELLGYYTSGHPLDKFRDILDSARYQKLGHIEELDLSNPRQRFPFAGLLRSVESRVIKSTGKPFGVVTVEDLTGAREVTFWGESFFPARDAGVLEVGKVIRFKAQVRLDERSGNLRINGSEISELKVRPGKSKNIELTLWPARTGPDELEEIRDILRAHPGTIPVRIHFQNSAGQRITLELGEEFRVRKDAKLAKALHRWTG